ncbi:uncharacterized protein LOC9656266 [Selaginella moellendorffii]|nr:uncharacterized protein LOC9656266 [Selaginella moellendorffii]|eukprot:XP_002980645.2 uncharacterized protein LOC9656266 [Selaginella moellendorffii]
MRNIMPWGRIASIATLSRSPSSSAPIEMGACFSRTECPCEARRNSSVAPAAEISGSTHFVRLSGLAISPFTARVRIALQFKGIQPDLVEPQLQDPSAWLDFERFPVLEHGSDTISGSSDAILDYIDRKFKQPPLIPSWKLKKKIRQWIAFVRDVFTPLVLEAWKNKDLRLDNDFHAKFSAAFGKLNAGIAENSSGGKFFMGAAMTMVDVYLVPFLELVEPLKFLHGINVGDENTKLADYIREMGSFPSYSPVSADKATLHGFACKELEDRSQGAPAVAYTVLQHLSIVRHLERLVDVSDGVRDFYHGQGKSKQKKKSKPQVAQRGSTMIQVGIATKLKNAARDYDRLLALMQEHAQMEEKVIFPALEKAERGVTKFANEDHARDFPMMNGVREDIKTVMVLEQGSFSHIEALSALADKLRTLKGSTVKHFLDEERELLPSLEVAGVDARKQELLMADGLSLMGASHSHLLPYLLSALLPHEIHQYMVLLQRSFREQQGKVERVVTILRSDDEFQGVWQIVQDRVPLVAADSVVASP